MSYSRRDAEVARNLEAQLSDRGFSVWRDDRRLVAGDDLGSITDAIPDCSFVVVLRSQASIDSQWVAHEIETALAHARPLYVVRIDDAPMPAALANVLRIELPLVEGLGAAASSIAYAVARRERRNR